jgi:hypothetical protein
MAKIPIYPGSSSFFPGDTPFGFYDNDYQFQQDADKVTEFIARRLGYPIMDVELQDVNFYTAFEEAITTYGNELYAYKVREDYLSLEGATTGSKGTNLNHSLIRPNFGPIVRYSEQYGEEAGTGGTTTWYSGSIALTKSVQDYDMNAWAATQGINDGDIEIKRIFYETAPAIVKYFDPYAGTGTGMMNLIDSFGWGNYSPAINFLLMPVSYDMQKIQAIEFNDQIRKSQFSFELINNKLRIFPLPNAAGTLWFQYIKKSERNNPTSISSSNVITNVSNVPYDNPTYTQINSIGRSWIFEYTLAVCKEMLGYIRGKYSQVPIPGAEVTLNQSDLVTAATNEKTALIERLRSYFDETSRDKLMERRAAETENRIKELNAVPYPIYIG